MSQFSKLGVRGLCVALLVPGCASPRQYGVVDERDAAAPHEEAGAPHPTNTAPTNSQVISEPDSSSGATLDAAGSLGDAASANDANTGASSEPAEGDAADVGSTFDAAISDAEAALDASLNIPDAHPPQDSGLPNGEAPFSITVSEHVVDAGQSAIYCYYFHTPNDAALGIKQLASTMTSGVRELLLYYGDEQQPADGTLSPCNYPLFGSGPQPALVYLAQTPESELTMPDDDGNGTPLAISLEANQPAFLQMRYVNTGAEPTTEHASLTASTYPAGTAFTQTATYLGYNAAFSIPALATQYSVAMGCQVPDAAKFWSLSTLSNQYSTWTEIADDGSPLFTSNDWQSPGVASFAGSQPAVFSSGALTLTCTYTNTEGHAVSGGTNLGEEECVAIGYYFPATGPRTCVNGTLLP